MILVTVTNVDHSRFGDEQGSVTILILLEFSMDGNTPILALRYVTEELTQRHAWFDGSCRIDHIDIQIGKGCKTHRQGPKAAQSFAQPWRWLPPHHYIWLLHHIVWVPAGARGS